MVASSAAQLGHDQIAFRRRRGVAPKLGRANDLAGLVQRDKSVLLPAHANGGDFAGGGLGLFERGLDRLGRRRRARCGDAVPWRRAAGRG